jgi:hypothetical protein
VPDLNLKIVDAAGHPIHDRGTVLVRDRTSDRLVQVAPLHFSMKFKGLRRGPHLVTVRPRSYRRTSRFVMVPGSLDVAVLVNPRKVTARIPSWGMLPRPLQDLLGRGVSMRSGKPVWDRMLVTRQATLLNLYAKCDAVAGVQVLAREGVELKAVLQDRCLCAAHGELYTRVAASPAFHEVNGALHEAPPPFRAFGGNSFKTGDKFGNLQLTFFRHMDLWRVDVDIDDNVGFLHMLDVVRHRLTNSKTHPFDIHDVLTLHQGLDTLYRLAPKLGPGKEGR